jgi:hypothetical protein
MVHGEQSQTTKYSDPPELPKTVQHLEQSYELLPTDLTGLFPDITAGELFGLPIRRVFARSHFEVVCF